nr:DUF4255 domain-containing protein [Lachnospiraceae bacterium]
DLYYMLIPFSRSDLKYRPSEEQKLLGKMLQVLWDYPNLSSAVCEEEPETGLHTAQVELLDIGYEEKARIWNGLNEAMRVALYCRVNPVELESCRSRSVRRVREMEMQFGERDVDHG